MGDAARQYMMSNQAINAQICALGLDIRTQAVDTTQSLDTIL